MGDHQRIPAVVCFSTFFFFPFQRGCGSYRVVVMGMLEFWWCSGRVKSGSGLRSDPIDAERSQGGVTTTSGPRVAQHRMVHNTVYNSLKLRVKSSVSYTFPQYTYRTTSLSYFRAISRQTSDRSALKRALLPLRARRLHLPNTPVFSYKQPIYKSQISQV